MPPPPELVPRPYKVAKVSSVSDRYLVDHECELGDGAFARVFPAREIETGEERAVKILEKFVPAHGPKDASEADVLGLLQHSNIIRLHEVLETPDEVAMVFDRMQTDLYAELARRPRNQLHEKEARELARQLISALAHMHSCGVVHRDIKPENVLLNAVCDVRLADFGFAKVASAENEPAGTTFYMPPEVLRSMPALPSLRQRGQPLTADEARAGDMWSLGVVLFFALTGRPPFVGQPHPPAMRRKLLAQMDAGPQYGDDRWRGVSDSARDLVRGLLSVDVQSRLTAEQALAHPWLRCTLPPDLPNAAAAAEGCRQTELKDGKCQTQPVSVPVGCPA